ncbi:MAG: hypothetical protein EZS28_043223, partial [Streblomastix strix]
MESDTPGNLKDPPIEINGDQHGAQIATLDVNFTDFSILSQQPSTVPDMTLGLIQSSSDGICLSNTPKPITIQQSVLDLEPKLPLAAQAYSRSNSLLDIIHHIPHSAQTQSNATPVSSDVVDTTPTSVANVSSSTKRVNVPMMPRVSRSETAISF